MSQEWQGEGYLDCEVRLLLRSLDDTPLVDCQPHGPLVHVYLCVSQSQEVALLHELNCNQNVLAQEQQEVDVLSARDFSPWMKCQNHAA